MAGNQPPNHTYSYAPPAASPGAFPHVGPASPRQQAGPAHTHHAAQQGSQPGLGSGQGGAQVRYQTQQRPVAFGSIQAPGQAQLQVAQQQQQAPPPASDAAPQQRQSAAAVAMAPPQPTSMEDVEDEAGRPPLCSGLWATCPMICAARPIPEGLEAGGILYTPLMLTDMKVDAELHITTAFVTVTFDCFLPRDSVHDPRWPCMFFLPKHYDTTVTEVTIENESHDKVYATYVVPNDEAAKLSGQGAAKVMQVSKNSDPELFQLTLQGICPGDKLKVSTTFFQPMVFEDGQFKLKIPIELPLANMDLAATPLHKLLTVNCSINTGTAEAVRYTAPSHPTRVVSEDAGRVVLAAEASATWENRDFEVGYTVWHRSIVASCNVQPAAAADGEAQGTFCINISPPAPDSTQAFARSVLFLVDRSASMAGDPIKYASQALTYGLDLLTANDEVNIIAYDHEQRLWSQQMMAATRDNIQAAKAFIKQYVVARGLTNIATPMDMALNMLKACKGVPYVYLLTDGAVDNERDICRNLEAYQGAGAEAVLRDGATKARITTFAIGPFCNHFFLKQLAQTGRGSFDVAFRAHRIKMQMQRMLTASAKPVLTDLSLGIEGLGACELYPFPIPDLFCGMPLVISGRYEGTWPEAITLHGRLPGGEAWEVRIPSATAAHIPLAKVFVKQRLDLLTAKAWLDNSPGMKDQVVELSVQAGVPCAHTTMVGFQTTKEGLKELQACKKAGRKPPLSRMAIGGYAAIGLIASATAAFAFGDLAMSLTGASVGDAMGAVGGDVGGAFGDIGGGDCCGGFGDCCGDCCEHIGTCLTCCF